MSQTSQRTFGDRLAELKDELVAQGRTVQAVIDEAVEAVFDRDQERAAKVIHADEAIDQQDVRIEKKAVQLLADAVREGGEVDHEDLRMILTIVKVNNEFERIADLAVRIAERVGSFIALDRPVPTRFRLMANSVIGIMHNTNVAFDRMDTDAAQLVLASDDATDAFKEKIVLDIEQGLARGDHTADYAFALNRVAASLARMADHCTNVAEQVIYVRTGKIVRHTDDRWTEPAEPRL